MFQNGCANLGIESVVAPLAILSAPFEDRPPCINRGFCNQGCMPNAKFSTLIVHIPKVISAGAEVLPNWMVTQILMDRNGRAKGVEFIHEGKTYKQEAKLVILSAFVVETPRLLLNSFNAQFPNGLANSSGWVGKAFMPHSSHDVYGKFDDEIRLYKGTPVLVTTQEFYRTNPKHDFVRGYTLHAHGARPLEFINGVSNSQNKGLLWGQALRQVALDYNYYGRVTLVGEVLPNEKNTITLADEKDEYGLPRAKVTFSYGENDQKIILGAKILQKQVICCRQIEVFGIKRMCLMNVSFGAI